MNAVVFNATSDARAKTNIRSLGYGLSDVLKMTGHKYEMIEGNQTSIGLIAQEVQNIIPEVVSSSANGMLGINYSVLTAVLIEAIKELVATNEFFYVPDCLGMPTTIPVNVAGKTPMAIDSTNGKLYVYNGDAWTEFSLTK